MNIPHTIGEDARHVIDWIMGAIAIATLVKALPLIASGLTAVWMLMRIGDGLARWSRGKWLGKD